MYKYTRWNWENGNEGPAVNKVFNQDEGVEMSQWGRERV